MNFENRIISRGQAVEFVVAVGIGPGSIEGIVARARTPEPAWLTEVRASAKIERMSSCIHVDVAKLKESLLPVIGDGVDGNDLEFTTDFPYLASPHSGNP